MQDQCDNAANAGDNRFPDGSICTDRHKIEQKGCDQEEQAIDATPADIIFHKSVKNRNDGLPTGYACFAEDLPVRNNLKNEPYQL